MSKELEALKRMEYFVNETMGIKAFKQSGWHIEGTDDYELVKEGLQRLEAIDNANPSEALEMLYGLKNGLVVGDKSILAISMGYFDKAYTTIKQALLKGQEQEKELADVEEVKSGKTIIYIGKDLIMMNKAKYNEYVEIKREPVSKRILQAKCEEQEKVLKIIKERHIDILSLEECIEREKMGNVASALEYYNENYAFNRSCELTKEELEVLKKILGQTQI